MNRRRARWGLALAASALALLCAEAALRFAGFSYPNFYRPDPVRGWALHAGEEAWWRREGDAFVRINREGFRDRERTVAKPPGAWRLAVLGDSFVEALQVPLEESFPALLERALAACPTLAGRRVEVLNFGVSGYCTAQELLTLRTQVSRFQPDAVLLAFFAGNDVLNNHRGLDANPARPYFELDAGGELRLDDSFRRSSGYRLRARAGWLYALVNRSRLLQLGKAASAARRARGRSEAAAAVAADGEAGLEEAVYQPPQDPRWQQAWRLTEALVRRMASEATASGATFGVVTLTSQLQVHPEPEVRRRAQERMGVADLDEPDRRLRALGAAAGFPVLNLAPSLRALAEQRALFLHGFPNTAAGTGHWNAAGHAAAAAQLAPWVCARLANGG